MRSLHTDFELNLPWNLLDRLERLGSEIKTFFFLLAMGHKLQPFLVIFMGDWYCVELTVCRVRHFDHSNFRGGKKPKTQKVHAGAQAKAQSLTLNATSDDTFPFARLLLGYLLAIPSATRSPDS